MNIQPYGIPAKHWPPKLTRWWFQCARPFRGKALRKQELERFAVSRPGPLPDRIAYLASAILSAAEGRYGISSSKAIIPERVKEVRRRIIQQQQEGTDTATDEIKRQWTSDMEDMFLVTQLYSYPGDYLIANPSWERLAETLDKLEEDALGANYPTIRARSAAKVRFDEPIELPRGKEKKMSAAELTDQTEMRVQSMLDSINAQS